MTRIAPAEIAAAAFNMDWTTFVLSRPPDDQDSPILVDADIPERTISWQQYLTTIKNVATGLRHAGLQDQDCVGVLSVNDIYYHVLGDAVVAAGGIFCAMQTSEKSAELKHQLKAASVKWLFASPRFLGLAVETAIDVGLCKAKIMVYDPPGTESYAGPQSGMSRLLLTDGKDWQNPNTGKDPHSIMAYRWFSSGTTGFPKAANISHAAHIIRLNRPEARIDVPIPSLPYHLIIKPLHHLTSLMICHRAFLGLQRVFITSTKDTKDVPAIIDLVRKYHISSALIAPPFLVAFVHAVRSNIRSIEDLVSLDGIRIAGSAVDSRFAEDFRATFPNIAFRVTYGATELGTIVRVPGPHEFVPGHVGRVADDVEIKFIDPDTQEQVKDNEDGELCVRTPQQFSAYNNNPEATKAAMLPGGWFRTGDRGHINPQIGQLAFTGRYKEIFEVAHSTRVAPEEIESVILCHPAVEDAAIGPTPARQHPDELEVRAYVVLKEGKTVTAHEIAEFVAGRLSKHKVPTGGVIFCEDIPRNALQKVIRRQIRDVVSLEGSREWICLGGV